MQQQSWVTVCLGRAASPHERPAVPVMRQPKHHWTASVHSFVPVWCLHYLLCFSQYLSSLNAFSCRRFRAADSEERDVWVAALAATARAHGVARPEIRSFHSPHLSSGATIHSRSTNRPLFCALQNHAVECRAWANIASTASLLKAGSVGRTAAREGSGAILLPRLLKRLAAEASHITVNIRTCSRQPAPHVSSSGSRMQHGACCAPKR